MALKTATLSRGCRPSKPELGLALALGMATPAFSGCKLIDASISPNGASRCSSAESEEDWSCFAPRPALAVRWFKVSTIRDGVSAGENLDGIVSVDEGSGCDAPDSVDPNLVPGIDNTIGRYWAAGAELDTQTGDAQVAQNIALGRLSLLFVKESTRTPAFVGFAEPTVPSLFRSEGLLLSYQTFQLGGHDGTTVARFER